MSTVSINPSQEEVTIRSKQRILRIRDAITNELQKENPSTERLDSLRKELDSRIQVIREFVQDII